MTDRIHPLVAAASDLRDDLVTYLPPPWVVWEAGVVCALALTVAALLKARSAWRSRAADRPKPTTADLLTMVAAGIATIVAGQGMWQFLERILGGIPWQLRALMFAFLELAVVVSAIRARRNMRENYSAGIDGMAVWALTSVSAVLAAMEASSLPEAIFRLAAPLVAAWLWERGMAIERHRITGRGRINWRLTPERMMVAIGLAEAADRTTSEVDVHRRLNRAALAVIAVDAAATGSARRQRSAAARLRARIAEAVEHTGLATDPVLQRRLLDLIDALRSGKALAARQAVAHWANPITQEAQKKADAALDELLKFDSQEATQRAIDKTALTLMALVESAPVVTKDVTNRVTNDVTPALEIAAGGPADVTPAVTSSVTTPGVTIGVTEEVTPEPDERSKTKIMRALWDAQRAEGVYPTVTELAEHADAHHTLASRLRRSWVDELPWREKKRATKREKASA